MNMNISLSKSIVVFYIYTVLCTIDLDRTVTQDPPLDWVIVVIINHRVSRFETNINRHRRFYVSSSAILATGCRFIIVGVDVAIGTLMSCVKLINV